MIIGVDVLEGTLRVGTPICAVKTDPTTKERQTLILGKVISLEINHQPVQLNGADYLSVRTVKNQMVEATFQIDTSALGALNTVYAIAVTPEDGELEINNPVKTASVLLVNGEV